MPNQKKIIQKYEVKHTVNLYQVQKEVEMILRLPEQEIISIAKGLSKATVNKSAVLKAKLDLAQKKLQRALGDTFKKYGDQSARLSDEKIKELLYDAFRKPAADIIVAKEFATGSEVSANIFKRRAKEGFDLSDRVWKLTKQKRFELDNAVKTAINQGTPAKDLAKTIQKYLREPDRVFRRVKDENGNLVESESRKEYKPGKGVYKSSEANAMRLARNEVNIAYRSADFERWQTMDMIKGIEVKLSNRHPVYDICDDLKGKYPKDFKFTGWHPQCLCHAEPILITDKELNKYEDYLLGITDKQPTFTNVSTVPEGLKSWMSDNKDRINGWKSKPYWMADNKSYLEASKR